jgi:glycerol-1-phosphate dehydrogenase [NAD(P)+]
MLRPTQIAIPTLVRAKDGALDRLGLYLGRSGHRKVAVFLSAGLVSPLPERVTRSLKERSVEAVAWVEVADNDLESTARLFADLPKGEVHRGPQPPAVLRGADLALQRRVL